MKPQYSTSLEISSFRGINQTGDGANMNLQYAREMENVNIEGGGFKPMREGYHLPQMLDSPIGTLAYLHRRYGNSGTLLVAISAGEVYTKTLDGDDAWVNRGGELAVNDCDWITYEISLYPDYDEEKDYVKGERIRKPGTVWKCLDTTTGEWDSTKWEEVDGDPDAYKGYDPTKSYAADDMVCNPVSKNYKAKDDITAEPWDEDDWDELTGTDPVDILLFSNATDGMFCLYGDNLDLVPVQTPKKFGVLARYNERVWGSGIDGDPDMLVYSAPFDPFDWSPNFDIPEDGAGDILQPTWDGDSFVSLKQYGNTLLCIKRNSIWRISGTNPGEFVMQMQYGGGTIAENTVAVYNDYAYMLGEYGLMQYNGSGAFPFLQEATQLITRKRLNRKYREPEYSEKLSYLVGDRCSHNGTVYRCNTEINLIVERDYGEYQEAVEEAEEYSDSASYAAGDVCIHERKYYVCTTSITGEDWDEEHWDLLEGTIVKSYGEYQENVDNAEPYTTTTYNLDDVCSYQQNYWICISEITEPEEWDEDHWEMLKGYAVIHSEEWTPAHWDEVTGSPMDNVCAGMWNGTYCLALPLDESGNCNAILQYDTVNRTIALRTGISVNSFLQINERLFYTSASYPGVVYELDDTKGEAQYVSWVSGYQDLGLKESIKSAFTVYMMVDTETPFDLRLGIRTEKKLKEKIVTIRPGKMTRAHLNTQGRIFRLEIKSFTAAPFSIAGGIHIELELDPD